MTQESLLGKTDKPVCEMGRARIWLIRVGLLAFAFLSVVALPEAMGRAYIWSRHGVAGKSYGLWKYDSELGAIHASNSYNTHTQTNNFGFRGTEDVLDPKPSGSLRVICYGGSSTYCYNLADGQTWPEQLQKELRTTPGHEQDQVLNGGHIAWSLGHLFVRAKRDLPALKPDVVVLYVGVNEDSNAFWLQHSGYQLDDLLLQQRFGVISKNLDQCRWLKRNSVLARFYDYEIKPKLAARTQPGGKEVETADEHQNQSDMESDADFVSSWTFQNYKLMLARMVELIRENGGLPIFVIEAGRLDIARNRNVLRYSARAADWMRELKVAVCDPRSVFESHETIESLFYFTGVHVSEPGAKLLAHELARTVTSLSSEAQVSQSADGSPVTQ